MGKSILAFTIAVLLCNPILLGFAIFAFWFGRKERSFGKTIIETGIIPANGGLRGPEKDTKVPVVMGYFFFYMSLCWFAAGWLALLAALLWTILAFTRIFLM